MTLRNALGFVGLFGILAIGCGGDEAGNNCGAACSVITSCWDDTTASCMAQCEGDLGEAAEFGTACVDAVNAVAACIGGLSCQQLDAWFDEIPADSYPCRAQDIAIDEC